MTVYYAYGAEKRFLLCAGTAEPDEFSPAEPVDYDGFNRKEGTEGLTNENRWAIP